MSKKIGLFVLFIVASFGLPVQAASLPVPFKTQTINIGTVTDLVGNINVGSNDWLLDIQPPGTDASGAFEFASVASGITFEVFECAADCTPGTGAGWASISGQVNVFSTLLLGTNEYFVRLAGPNNRGYVVAVSAVPLPAAALLFLSGLAGFGLLSRGKKESTDTDMPLLAA